MKTIRGKLFIAFLGLVLIIFFILWLSMEFFIEPYYYRQKVTTMQKTIQQIETIIQVSPSPIDRIQDFEYLGYNFEGKISIYDAEAGIVISDEDVLKYSKGKIIKNIEVNGVKAYILETNYPVKETRWLVYSERLSSNGVVMLQIPITAMDQTLEAISAFMSYVGIIILIIAMIMAGIISTNMTRPIKRLTLMANELRQLKFDVLYEEDRKDEFGQLGATFNALATRLDATIKALQYELSKEKALDVLRKEFVAQVSHELQTPLSIIHGYIEALEDGVVESDEERKDYYKIIYEESDKMSHMIKDLLQLSELEAGTFSIIKEEMDLKAFFDHIQEAYQTLLIQSDKSLHYKTLKTPIMFKGDRIKLEQAIRNILNNAIKYADEGSIIRFETLLVDRCVTVTISNTGPNIEDDDIPKIFGSFYKGKNSEGKEGTGIGLAVAGKVFDHHQISYIVRNTFDGVKFIMRFPLDEILVI
ncbi:MAG: hypothetical protein CVU98_11155 [Firmicutes bacterium HGW-Firmicutes-3]|nr:MAG: hypothetical protein CVU98_11155 [Firmicutes bacterium HGW-Firmicutes-3]